MLRNRLEIAKQAWGGVNGAVDHWLEERQDLLVKFYDLEGLIPCKDGYLNEPSKSKLTAFFEILVDYLSTGHFEIFEQIVNQCEENGPKTLSAARKIHPTILASTEMLMEFHDKYLDREDVVLANLDQDMSKVIEVLDKRFYCEDKLLMLLATFHS